MNVPPDYDRDREGETWLEAHPATDKRQNNETKRRKGKRANQELRNFGKINWEHHQHPGLYNMIMTAKVEGMNQRSREWRQLAERIESTTQQVQQVVSKAMGNWHGSAAVAAAASNTRLTQWAGDASHIATQIAAGMANYTEAVEEAQHRMPPPGFADAERNFRAGYTVMTTGGPSDAILIDRLLTDHLVSHEQARAAKAEAVAVMEAYEFRSREVYDDMPRFTTAAESDVGPAEAPPVDPDRPPITPDPPRDNDPRPPREPLPPAARPDVPPGGTTPEAFVSSGPGGPGSTGGLPGGGGGYGSGADAARGGAGFGGATGGVAGTGPLAARGAGLAGANGAGGLAGARGGVLGGAGAAGGMYPGMAGAGAHGDEDKEHTNKYDDGLDLFDDLPPAYPPVFGA